MILPVWFPQKMPISCSKNNSSDKWVLCDNQTMFLKAEYQLVVSRSETTHPSLHSQFSHTLQQVGLGGRQVGLATIQLPPHLHTSALLKLLHWHLICHTATYPSMNYDSINRMEQRFSPSLL